MLFVAYLDFGMNLGYLQDAPIPGILVTHQPAWPAAHLKQASMHKLEVLSSTAARPGQSTRVHESMTDDIFTQALCSTCDVTDGSLYPFGPLKNEKASIIICQTPGEALTRRGSFNITPCCVEMEAREL